MVAQQSCGSKWSTSKPSIGAHYELRFTYSWIPDAQCADSESKLSAIVLLVVEKPRSHATLAMAGLYKSRFMSDTHRSIEK